MSYNTDIMDSLKNKYKLRVFTLENRKFDGVHWQARINDRIYYYKTPTEVSVREAIKILIPTLEALEE